MERKPAEIMNLITRLKEIIERQVRLEREGDLPDVQCAMVSLLYAEQALDKVHASLSPQEFLRQYIALLENRISRLDAEDAGEYGSGRDSLGSVIDAAERLLLRVAPKAA